jgi:hypothetical protein
MIIVGEGGFTLELSVQLIMEGCNRVFDLLFEIIFY